MFFEIVTKLPALLRSAIIRFYVRLKSLSAQGVIGNATRISNIIFSDWICSLRIKLSQSDNTGLSIFAVYLPCELSVSYCEPFGGIGELIISESQCLGPVVIVGDFNARLGSLGGVRGQGNPNQHDILFHQFLIRYKHVTLGLI